VPDYYLTRLMKVSKKEINF